jgi:hypothetical protein
LGKDIFTINTNRPCKARKRKTMKNAWTKEVEGLRSINAALLANVQGKEMLLDKLSQENLDLKVEVGRLRGLLQVLNIIIQRATGHKGV